MASEAVQTLARFQSAAWSLGDYTLDAGDHVDCVCLVIAGNGYSLQVWQALLEQSKTSRNLCGAHLLGSLNVGNQVTENVAISDFIAVFF
jgi:hypothetical protein